MVAKAAADGYTLAVVATSHAINPSVSPVAHTVNLTNLLVVNPAAQANNLQELVALAKRKPGSLSFGSAGIGQSNHLSGEMLRVAAGIDIVRAPYKGSAAAMNDVLAAMPRLSWRPVSSASSPRPGRSGCGQDPVPVKARNPRFRVGREHPWRGGQETPAAFFAPVVSGEPV